MIIKGGGNSVDIRTQLAMAKTTASTLSNTWKSRNITRPTKIRVIKVLVFPIVIYGCETWAVGKAGRRAISAFEMWCRRKLLGISKRDHITNEHIQSLGGKPSLLPRFICTSLKTLVMFAEDQEKI